jgi:hypothetical protein
MALVEEEIINEKDLSISKDSVEKSNSLVIKSLDEGAFNFVDLIKDKLVLLITTKNKINVQISNKSIFKIFNILCDKDKGEYIENFLSDYITCSITEENNSYKDDFILNNQENSLGILDTPYIKLLEQTQDYKISINSTTNSSMDEIKQKLLNYDDQKNIINIKSTSMGKICKYLNKSIYDISDYINILVLYLNNQDDFNIYTIKSKIIDKYSQSGLNAFFMGKKLFESNVKVPIKNEKNPLFKFDDLFENILNKIENIENNSSDDFDEIKDKNNTDNNNDKLDTPKKFIEQKIKINKVNYDDNEDEINNNSKNKCNCQKDICSFCNIY